MTEGKANGPITAYCDGGSRGNPGPAGYGVFIQDQDSRTVGELSDFIGIKTNNVAEYSGLLAALEFALAEGHTHLRVVSDSELMVKQMKGQYRVNSPDLKPLFEEAKRRAGQLKKFEMQHVLRGKNKEADRLANEAMDRGTGRGPAGRPGASRPAASPSAAPARAETRPVTRSEMRSETRSEIPPETQVDARVGSIAASSAPAAPRKQQQSLPLVPSELPKEVTGFVKNGVVHLVEGELPEGTFVRILPARR